MTTANPPRSREECGNIHGTCVLVLGIGVLLRGPSGSGKSDLALRLIEAGAHLVADDRVDLRWEGEQLMARAPERLRGVLEVRGVGLVTMPHVETTALALVVDLVPPDRIERLPDPTVAPLCGGSLPRLTLAPFEVSAAAKLKAAVAALASGSLFACPPDPVIA